MTLELFVACRYGDLKTVINELDKGVDPAAEDNYAIRLAAEDGHLPVVERLLQDQRVDPSAMDNFAIECAAKMGQVKTVVMLFEHLKRSHPETIEALKNNEDIKACFREKRDAYLLASSFFRQAPPGNREVFLAALERETALCKDDADNI